MAASIRLRMAVVWNIPIACNRASADLMISSPLMDEEYDRLVPDYDTYRTRKVPVEVEIEVEERVGTPNAAILDGDGLED